MKSTPVSFFRYNFMFKNLDTICSIYFEVSYYDFIIYAYLPISQVQAQ